uniref:Uncharacterized protein n=1 Tax=Setaria digitata TaxID=48799 RepID=A0A915PWC8_9BILA
MEGAGFEEFDLGLISESKMSGMWQVLQSRPFRLDGRSGVRGILFSMPSSLDITYCSGMTLLANKFRSGVAVFAASSNTSSVGKAFAADIK